MRAILFLLFSLANFGIQAQQSSRLAMQYYQTGEFEKAADLFEKLYQEQQTNTFYFDKYIECLIELERYAECERIINKRIKSEPDNIALYVKQGQIREAQYDIEGAEKLYRESIKKVQANRLQIIQLASEFSKMSKYQMAIETYEKGEKLLRVDNIFAYNMGNLYRQMGERSKMIEYFLNALENQSTNTDNVKLVLDRYLEDDDWTSLKGQLLQRIQDDPNNTLYTELLAWYYIQQNEFRSALRQQTALDRRLNENGERVYSLASMATNAGDYDVAIRAYQYIITQKGSTNPFYLDSQTKLLQTKQRKITEGYQYTHDQLLELEKEYQAYLAENGQNKLTAKIMVDLAELEAYYMNDLQKAIDLLKSVTELPGLDEHLLANAKIALGDFYLISGDRWESTLLYSQVDKAFKDDILGQIARFKNAKLSYYVGDFQWAQTQFDVLKSSTSKLISNDALDLSVFIMDNLGLDTSTYTMEQYASAELLIFQNKFEEARAILDELEKKFWDHSLTDDIIFAKAQMFEQKREYAVAAELYQRIVDEFSDDIRADNSLFALANLYENQLGQPEKAQTLYEMLFIDYSNSTFAVEARKRFRILRGDFEES